MATDALKINKTTNRVETLNGFQLHDGTNRVYSDGNKPTPGTLGAVAKSGDTLTGNLKGPEFIQTTPQSNDGAASARKDYVDAKFKAVTVPTGTAPIVVNNSVISIVPSSASTAGSMSAADKSKLDGISDYVVDGKAIKLTGPINFDSLDLTGFYTLYTVRAAKSVNPPPFDYGTLVVVGSAKTAGTFVTQIATDRTSGVTYIRTRNDGTMTWSDWNKQYSEKSKPTLDELNAAPAGFGLGEKSGFSLSGKSCNDAIESGFYSVFDGTKDTPYTSTGPSGSSLLVQRWGDGACSQTFISYAADRMHIRRQYKGEWLPWVEVYTESHKPTPAEVGAVNLVGDTMTGSLKAPDFIQTTAQSTNVASCTRKDYVDAQIKVIDDKNFTKYPTNLAADLNTLGKTLDAGVYRQEANANATAAKNYPVAIAGSLIVTPSAYGCQQEYTTFTGRKFQRGLKGAWNGTDGPWGEWTEFYSEVSPVKFVDKTGDTMTGPLVSTQFKASGDYGFVRSTDLVQGMFVGADKRTIIGGGVDTGYVLIRPNGIGNTTAEVTINANGITAKDFIQNSAQSTNVASCTRKDYVDAQIKAVNTSIAAVDAKNVAKAGDTMTGALNFAQIKSAASFWNKSSIRFADGANTHFHLFSEGGAFKISSGTTGQTNMVSIDGVGNMDIAGSTISKYFRTDELGGTNTVAPYRSASSGGTFAAMYNRHASFHTDVVQAGSSYAPNTSIKYQHNNNYAGMFSTGVLSVSAVAQPGTYSIAHVDSSGNRVYTWSFSGGDGKFSSAIVDATSVDVSGLVTAGQIRTTTGGITINNSNPTVLFQDTDNKSAFAHVNSNNFYILRSAGNNGTAWDSGPNNVHPMTLNLDNGDATFSRNGSFNDVQIRSDIRLKSNFKAIKSALDKVDTLTGMTFDKVGCDKREAGLIAQDVQAVLPESVGSFKTTAGDEFLTLSSSGVNALLVEAIKELRAEFNQFKSQLRN